MENEILRPAFPGYELYVDPTDGGTITDAAKNWNGSIFVASEFNDPGLNKKSRPTGYTNLYAYELISGGTLQQMFDEVRAIDLPLLKQSQIARWLQDNPALFKGSAVIFFFFKKEKAWWNKVIEFLWPDLAEIFVARVNLMEETTYIFPATLGDQSIWKPDRHRHYIITPF